MKTIYFLMAILLFCNINVNAQFTDDMETCTFDGEIIEIGHWTDWGCGGGPGCGIICSSEQAHSGLWSGLIPDDGTTDAVLDLGNKIFGYWSISFWMYVPSNKEAYWNLQGEVPIGAGEWIVGNFFFNQDLANPGVGLIDNTAIGEVNFNFPHDEWFNIAMNFDITTGLSSATWNMCVDGEEIIPSGTAFTDGAATVPTSLGGIDFFSISTNNYYFLDDFGYYANQPLGCILDVEDFKLIQFSIYPNPSESVISIVSDSNIEQVNIYSLQGILIKNVSEINDIDISHLSSGLYFIEVLSEKGKSVQKFIRE